MVSDGARVYYRGMYVHFFHSTRGGLFDKEWTRIEDHRGRSFGRKDSRWIGFDLERGKRWIDEYLGPEKEKETKHDKGKRRDRETSQSNLDYVFACGVLMVREPLTVEKVKQAHRLQAKLHHPDQGGDEEKMRLVSDAKAVLLKNLKHE